jgi:CheY-like chemotaxis protein
MPTVPPSPDSPSPTPFRGISVLVVDDDTGVLDETRQILERLGAWVAIAQTGAAGLRAAALHRPHLILIDLDMPVMDGFELARRFRQDTQLGRCRLVALTSARHRPSAMRGWSVEFDGHIEKPVTAGALTALARHVPGGRASAAPQ